MILHVDWLAHPNYADGGCWALFTSNGRLVAEMVHKGKHKRAYKIALELSVGHSLLNEHEAQLAE